MNNPFASGDLRIYGSATLNGMTKFTLGDWDRTNRTANGIALYWLGAVCLLNPVPLSPFA